MRGVNKLIYIIIFFSFLLSSCATQNVVNEKLINYLNKKYNEKFKVVSVNMNHDEGNWCSADPVISPENNR